MVSVNPSLSVHDAAYLLFGLVMPGLDDDARTDVVDCLRDGDDDLALTVLVKAIDRLNLHVDAKLLAFARTHALSVA